MESSTHAEGLALLRNKGNLSPVRGISWRVNIDLSGWVNVDVNLCKI